MNKYNKQYIVISEFISIGDHWTTGNSQQARYIETMSEQCYGSENSIVSTLISVFFLWVLGYNDIFVNSPPSTKQCEYVLDIVIVVILICWFECICNDERLLWESLSEMFKKKKRIGCDAIQDIALV